MAVRQYRDTQGRARYVIEFQQSGVRVLRRLPPSTSKAQAEEKERQLRSQVFDQRELGKVPELSLERAVDLWLHDRMHGKKDQRMPRQNAEHLRPFLRGRTVSEAADVARQAIGEWSGGARTISASSARPSAPQTRKASSAQNPLGAATINRRLAVLKAAVHYAWKQGWTAENVAGRIGRLREPPGREVYLSPSQIRSLAAAMPAPAYRAAVMLLGYTGLRAGELLSITAADIGKGSLMVRQSKTGKSRTVPLAGPCLPYVSALPLELSYQQLQWAFRAARVKAGMPHVHLHDLRHSAASMLINAGVDLYTVGKILGHLTPQTTARYSHLADATLRKAMRRLK